MSLMIKFHRNLKLKLFLIFLLVQGCSGKFQTELQSSSGLKIEGNNENTPPLIQPDVRADKSDTNIEYVSYRDSTPPSRQVAEEYINSFGFRLFDSLAYNKQPNLAWSGIEAIGGFGEAEAHNLWETHNYLWWSHLTPAERFKFLYLRLPDKSRFQSLVTAEIMKGRKAIYLDFEGTLPIKAINYGNQFFYNTCSDPGTCAVETQKRVDYYLTLYRWGKEVAPGVVIGHYGIGGFSANAPQLNSSDSEYQESVAEVAASAPILQEVDIVMPSLYVPWGPSHSKNMTAEQWKYWTTMTLGEITKYTTKPIIPFVWPEYNGESSPGDANRQLSSEYWTTILETAWQFQSWNVRGLVIWGSYDFIHGGSQLWDENSNWFLATKSFMTSKQGVAAPVDRVSLAAATAIWLFN